MYMEGDYYICQDWSGRARAAWGGVTAAVNVNDNWYFVYGKTLAMVIVGRGKHLYA